MMQLVRRVSIPASADSQWSHASAPDWSALGFTDPSGFQLPPGQLARHAAVIVVAEENGAELSGEHAATISLALVEAIGIGSASFLRERIAVDLSLGQLSGEFDLPYGSARLYPRITTALAGIIGSPTHLAIYMGVR